MVARELIVVGAGGFGRETLDVIEAHNTSGDGEKLKVVGVVDDAPISRNLARLEGRGYRYLGGIPEVLSESAPLQYLLGIGSPAVKRRLARMFDDAGWAAATIIHPSASIGSVRRLEEGGVICGGVQLSTNTELGRHVHLNPNATIGHDAVLADFVSVNPGAIVSGEVSIGQATLIGAGAVVLQGVTVGAESVVGASACVNRHVTPGSTVVGVPARPLERI